MLNVYIPIGCFCPGSISVATATVVPGVSAATSFARLYCRQSRFPEAREVLDPAAIAEIAESNDFSRRHRGPEAALGHRLTDHWPTKPPERMAASLRGVSSDMGPV